MAASLLFSFKETAAVSDNAGSCALGSFPGHVICVGIVGETFQVLKLDPKVLKLGWKAERTLSTNSSPVFGSVRINVNIEEY